MYREIKVSDGTGSPRRGTPLERVARIFPDCTTTVVVCGYVNRSQSKYICAHRCNAARGTRSVDRDAIVCLVPRAVSTFSLPRVMHKVRERVPWQKIDALRSRDKRSRSTLFSPSLPLFPPFLPFPRSSLRSSKGRGRIKKERNKRERERRKKSVREIVGRRSYVLANHRA